MNRQRLSLALAGVVIALSVLLAALASPAYGRPTHPRVDVENQVAFADHATVAPAARSANSIRAAADAGGSDRLTALMVWVAVVAMYASLYLRALFRQVSRRPSRGITSCRRRAPSRAPPLPQHV